MVLEDVVVDVEFIGLLTLGVPVVEGSCIAVAWTELSLFEF